MADDRLQLEARFKDNASAGVKKLGKTLGELKPGAGMAAANKWMGDFRAAAEKAHRATQPISTGLNALGVGGLAASLSLGEMAKQFRELADSTLTMRELGRQASMTATDIARVQYAAGKMHVSAEAVNGAISSWSSNMLDFRRHSSAFYRDLMKNNADVAAAIERDNPVEGLKRALDFISRIKDPQVQKRWADDAGLGDLVPMLGKGPDGVAAAFAAAGREVKPITDAMIEASERMNESTLRMNQSWSNLKNDIGPSVLDPMSHLIDQVDELLKKVGEAPGDAAAIAGIGGLSAAALYARRRVMKGSSTFGGGSLDRAAGEMVGAANEQKVATSTFAEAVAEFRAAVRESAAHGGGGGAPGGGGPGGGIGSSPGFANLLPGGVFAAYQMWQLANGMPDALERAKTDNAPIDPQVAREAGWGDAVRHAFGFGQAPAFHPDDDRLSRARRYGLTYDAPNHDGNALHRNDEIPAASLTAHEMFKTVKDGSKEGIVAGLREIAQQQDMNGSGGTGSGGVGAPSVRYGRDPATGLFRRGGHSGGGRNYPDTPDGQGNAAAVKGGMGLRAMAAMKYLVEKKGYTPEGAAIAVGNAMQESDVTPNGRPGDPGTPGGSHYMFQWNNGKHGDTVNGRRAKIERYWREHGLSPNSMEANLDAFDEERKHRSGLEADWHNQHDLRNAGRLSHLFEGFGDNSTPKRVQNARDMLSLWKKAHPGATHATGGLIHGPGTGTSDSIPAMLSDKEFVVNARASRQWLPLLHAINSGHVPGFADGGQVGAGVLRHRSWFDFFTRARRDGGMGAAPHVALGSMAMMMGESGRWLNPSVFNPNDVDGPSGGTAQWHDVVKGFYAGKIHRWSDLTTMAFLQHEDWHNVALQQAYFKREALGPMAYAWEAMRRQKTAAGVLNAGVRRFEVPADPGHEVLKRTPNLTALAREGIGGHGRLGVDPVQIDIRHHPHTGKPTLTARAGRGTRIKLRTLSAFPPT